MKIKSIWDNEGETFDRITVVFDYVDGPRGELGCLGMSETGLGYSMFAYCEEGPHLGKRKRWNELLPETRKHIEARLSPFVKINDALSKKKCQDCNGTGANESRDDKCPECKGKGYRK